MISEEISIKTTLGGRDPILIDKTLLRMPENYGWLLLWSVVVKHLKRKKTDELERTRVSAMSGSKQTTQSAHPPLMNSNISGPPCVPGLGTTYSMRSLIKSTLKEGDLLQIMLNLITI